MVVDNEVIKVGFYSKLNLVVKLSIVILRDGFGWFHIKAS